MGMRPWEWKVLEGISRNDASYIHEAIAEPHVNWEETVGRTYGDPNDRNHVYHQVQSFGGLRADEGNTLLKIALQNGSTNAAAAIEKHMSLRQEIQQWAARKLSCA